ncbi:MAG TPA: CmcI family methyltransferase [Alphaproteobacteria bacterium]|nr:CmcI family methyltransferase [Alphaproteobacteria bacterium]
MSRPWPKRVSVDFEQGRVTVETEGAPRTLPMSSPDAFEAVAAAYLRCGWDAKYVYSFSWLGRPIIQLPDDAFRMQELIFALKPDVIVETGLAHGGSAVFYASLCKLMGRGRIVGVEIELRPHNRAALDAHPLRPLITLIDGSSIDPATVARVRSLIAPGETVLVLLDSKHTKEHVLAELEAYAPLVSKGSYIVAMDGIMQHLTGAPRSAPDWAGNNPAAAARDFAAAHPDFELTEPPPPFNEGAVTSRVSYCPDAFLKRIT